MTPSLPNAAYAGAYRNDYADALTFGLAQNAPVLSTMVVEQDSPSPVWEWSAAYAALAAKPDIEYVDMPEAIRGSYQYFTQSDVDRLRSAGYNGGFTALEDAVESYVKGFLDRPDRFR